MSRFDLFLDDGGVMNDNAVRGPQWQRMVGEFFAPILGGTPEAWAEANRVTAPPLWQPGGLHALWEEAGREYSAFDWAYHRHWLTGMCEYLGLEPPLEEETVELARRAAHSITAPRACGLSRGC